jgi:hypothetical protein
MWMSVKSFLLNSFYYCGTVLVLLVQAFITCRLLRNLFFRADLNIVWLWYYYSLYYDAFELEMCTGTDSVPVAVPFPPIPFPFPPRSRHVCSRSRPVPANPLLLYNHIQGRSWVFVAEGVQTIEAPQAPRIREPKVPLGTPHKFSHRICTNLKGPPDRPWGGVRIPGPPRPATRLITLIGYFKNCTNNYKRQRM